MRKNATSVMPRNVGTIRARRVRAKRNIANGHTARRARERRAALRVSGAQLLMSTP
jgi:hypothetical protein